MGKTGVKKKKYHMMKYHGTMSVWKTSNQKKTVDSDKRRKTTDI